jgi:gas vesicle protein
MDNKALQGLAVCLLIGLIAGAVIGYSLAPRNTEAAQTIDKSAVNTSADDFNKKLTLYQDMRKLWSEHVMWTREYVIATLDNKSETPQVAQRLLKNQEDIGKAIVPYYGKAAGDQLGGLLKEHILVAVDLLDAAKSGNQTKFKDADARWHKNAVDLAAFLSKANPYWNETAIVEMLNMHINLTTQEAVAHMQKDYVKDIGLYDQIYNQILGMSDQISAGIIRQFPDKF